MSRTTMGFEAQKSINGKHSMIWLDGDLVFEATSCNAKVSQTTTPVDMCGKLAEQSKVTGYKGTFTITITKRYSRTLKLMSDHIKAGTTPEFTITSKVSDPNITGAETVTLTGAKILDLTLIDWKAGNATLNETLTGTFDGWDVEETIDLED